MGLNALHHFKLILDWKIVKELKLFLISMNILMDEIFYWIFFGIFLVFFISLVLGITYIQLLIISHHWYLFLIIYEYKKSKFYR
jgi:hypothetical protein